MAKKISFINFKGGVAKTTLAVNFAATLAKKEKKTLLVDLDPQSNASLWLLGPKRFESRIDEPEKTVYQLFLDRIPHISGGHLKFRFNDSVVKAVSRKKEYVLTPHLDLLPNTFEAIDLEHHLTTTEGLKHDILKIQLENIESKYKYIIFDCAPNLYVTTLNALLFSNYYIIPVYPDYFASSGLSILCRQIKKRTDMYKNQVGKIAKLLGVVITRIKSGAKLDKSKRTDLVDMLEILKKDNIISPKAFVFKTYFNDTVEVSRSIEAFIPSIYYKKYYDPIRYYSRKMEKFTDAVMNKI